MSTENQRPTRRPVRGSNDAASAETQATQEATAATPTVEEVVEFPVPAQTAPEPEAPAPAPLPEPEPVAAPAFEPESAPTDEPAPLPEPAIAVVPQAEEPRDETPLQPLVATEEPATKGKFGLKMPKKASEPTVGKKRSYSPKRKSLIITGSVVGGIVLVLGFSIYKVGQAPSTSDIVAMYQENSGDLGFPVDRGQAAAINFLTLYLNIPEDSTLRQQNKELLADMLIGASAPTSPSGVSQRIVAGPTPSGILYQEDAGTANQRYTALVETTVRESVQGTDINGNSLPDKVTTTLRPVTYRVNLVTDPTGTAVLVKGNPTLLPNTVLTSEMRVVPLAPTMDGQLSSELNESLIKPFLKVWAQSDTAAINSWLATGASGQWTEGLKGAQTLGNVTVSAPAGVKADGGGNVTVQAEWVAPDGTRQTSNYTVAVVYENSRWLVSDLS